MARTADEYIGNEFGGGIVGRLDYDWSFERMPFYVWVTSSWTAWGFGYQDATSFSLNTLNGAWGAWHDVPTTVNLYATALAAGNYASTVQAQTGWMWNALDDGLMNGSEGFYQYATVEERLARWNEILDLIDSSASWLWGNVRDGGVGFFRYDSNSVFNFATYGLYKNEEGDEKIVATVSNIIRGYNYYNADGVLTTFNHNRAATENCIYFTRNVPDISIYACTDPELGGAFGIDLWNVIWSGHDSTIDKVLVNEWAKMSIDGQDQKVPTVLISMGSIGSPYNGYHQDLYYPAYLDYDMGDWLLVSQDDGIKEGLSLGGGDTDTDGDGSFDNSSDAVPSTSLERFTVDAQDCGFVTVYKVPKETLTDFGKWLFSDHPDTFWEWIDEIKKMWDNPMDCIMSLNLCAYNANTGGERDISFFGQASGYKAPIVDGLNQIFDCGYLKTDDGSGRLREYSGNFLDYSSNCKISIFLPYCGQHTLQVSEVMGAKLHLQYVIDLLTGACIAELRVIRDRGYVDEDPNLDAVIYRFPGNIFQQIPIGASNYSSVLNGQLGLAASVASIATGNVAGGVTGAVNSIMSMSPHVERTGSAGSSYGYMSTQKPFIIQEYPWYNWNDKYDEYYGRPAYNYKKLGEASGYTEIDVDTLWTNKFPGITKEEEDLLKQELNSGGIYIDHDPAYYDYDPAA